MEKKYPILKDMLLAMILGVVLGSVISLFSPGNFWAGLLGIGLLGFLTAFGVIRICRRLQPERSLIILMIVTFSVRLLLGIILNQGLPVLGFDNEVQKAGYVFSDAYERDQAAYRIATSGGVFKQDLSEFQAADQYGGLLALSAVLYQVFSVDTHRPLLMVMISAFAMSIGLVFLYTAVTKKWNRKIAIVTGWIFALYPDGILLGSSQMREPILICLTCLLFWISLNWKEKPVRSLVYGMLVTIVTCLFSVPAGCAAFVIVAGIVFVDWFSGQQSRKTKWIAIGVSVIFLALVGFAGWKWLKESLSYEYYLTESNSGLFQVIFDHFGSKLKIPILTFYGLTQPLLPAALFDLSKPIWMVIAIFRAVGWYAAIPFIVYGFFAVFSKKNIENRSIMIFISFAFALWVLISSLRGGGDQWDNPRYRTTFLPWMAIMIAWVYQRVKSQKTPWFWRIVFLEAVFVLFFSYWYFNRKIITFAQIDYPVMVELILGISALTIIGGFVWDLIKKPAIKAGKK